MRAAAIEIAPHRINAIRPHNLHREPRRLRAYLPGMPSAGLTDVMQAYIRSAEGAQTGQVCALSNPFPQLIRLLVIVFAGPRVQRLRCYDQPWAGRMTG